MKTVATGGKKTGKIIPLVNTQTLGPRPVSMRRMKTMMYEIEICDRAVYYVEAETEEVAKMNALEWWDDRWPKMAVSIVNTEEVEDS